MKIVYCITQSEWGGAQTYVYELIKVERSKNKVYLVVGEEGALTEKVKRLSGVKVMILPSLKRNISLFNDLKAICQLRKIMKSIKPDILHLNSSKAGFVGRLAAVFLKTKTIFTVHGWAFTDGVESTFRKLVYRSIERLVAPMTDLFICVSNYDYQIGMRDKVLSVKKKNAVIIHNGVDEPVNFEITDKIIHDPVRILMTARFSRQKDQETLLKALANIGGENYEMVFLGDGPTLKYNKHLANNLGIGDNVEFKGFSEDVETYLKNCDIFVLSTNYEGLPISIIEAMSYGMPIIATNVGGNSELVENGKNGFLVDGSVESLRSALMKLMNKDRIVNQGLASLNFWNKHFKLKNQLEEIDNEYSHLIEKKSELE